MLGLVGWLILPGCGLLIRQSLFYLPEHVHSVNTPIYKFIQLILVNHIT
jgi:hypothetical protein